MESVLYHRIKELCSQKGITISKLESDLEFSNGSIKKWENASSPSVEKILKIAIYFDVTVDYLLGRTDIISSISDLANDKDIISFQRAREKMTPKDRERMTQMLKLVFDYAFQEDDNIND